MSSLFHNLFTFFDGSLDDLEYLYNPDLFTLKLKTLVSAYNGRSLITTDLLGEAVD